MGHPNKIILPVISVVVAFTRSEGCIINCLESIFGTDYPRGRLEVIVIDDSHDDALAELVQKRFPLVRLLRPSAPLGCDGAKQAGIDAATGDIIALTDADCTVCRSWARVMAKELNSGADAVTGPVRHPKTFLRELIGISDFQDFQMDTYAWTNNFPGCNFGASRELFAETRFRWNDSIRTGSDRLVSWYLYSAGRRICYDPAMVVYHEPQVDVANLLERRMRYGRTALSIRKLDPTLPGGALAKFILLASPAYVCYKVAKDVRCLADMTRRRLVNPLHVPLLFPALVLFRIFDAIGIATSSEKNGYALTIPTQKQEAGAPTSFDGGFPSDGGEVENILPLPQAGEGRGEGTCDHR